MVDEILKATLQLSRWKRGKGKNDKLFDLLYHKEKYIIRLQSPALLCGVLKTVFGPSDMLLPLDTNHCRQQPMFCQVFPGRIMGQSMLPLAQCEFLLSPSSLSLCGHRTKVWAFRHPVASRLCCSVFSPHPGHTCACSVPGHQHCPQSPASTHAAGALLGSGFSAALPGTCCNSGPSGGSPQPQAPHLHACPTSEVVL